MSYFFGFLPRGGSGGGSGTLTGANNGVSLAGDNVTVQFGQAVGAVGNPAVLLGNREIPMNNFFVAYTGGNVLLGKSVAGAGGERLQVVNNARFETADTLSYVRVVPGSGPNVVNHGSAPIYTFEETLSTLDNVGSFGIFGNQVGQDGNLFGMTISVQGGIFNYSFDQFGWFWGTTEIEGFNQGGAFCEINPGSTFPGASVFSTTIDKDEAKLFFSASNVNGGTLASMSWELANDSGGSLVGSIFGGGNSNYPNRAILMGSAGGGFVLSNPSSFIAFNIGSNLETESKGVINSAGNWILADGTYSPSDDGEKFQVVGDTRISGYLLNELKVSQLGMTLDALDSGLVNTNEGAGGTPQLFTLPTAQVGLIYHFVATESGIININPDAGDTITVGVTNGTNVASSGAEGNALTLLCAAANKWVAVSVVNPANWTVT